MSRRLQAKFVRFGRPHLAYRGFASASKPTVQAFTEENLDRYEAGGFNPVRLGDKLKDGQYRILRKLGYGLYSTVWLAHDRE